MANIGHAGIGAKWGPPRLDTAPHRLAHGQPEAVWRLWQVLTLGVWWSEPPLTSGHMGASTLGWEMPKQLPPPVAHEGYPCPR